MKALVVFLVTLALGSANNSSEAIGPTTTVEPSRDDRIKTAIDNNVQWLLRGIRNGSFVGLDLPRAVVALFLAEPGFFSPGHEIGQELRERIEAPLTELIREGQFQVEDAETLLVYRRNTAPSIIPSVELALYLQALLVSCANPYNFLGYDLTDDLYKSVLRHHCDGGNCTFPSPVMLALCNARATSKDVVRGFRNDAIHVYGGTTTSLSLTDEEPFLTMTLGCLESSNYSYPRDIPFDIRLRRPLHNFEYRHYPLNLTVEDFQEMMKPDGDPAENTTSSLSAIAAAMQNLMYNNSLQVSDLQWGVDFLLNNQDEDGSWGQSALNSFFVLPVLSNKSYLNITSDHCSEGSENKTLAMKRSMDFTIMTVLNGRIFLHWSSSYRPDTSLYDALTDPNFSRSEANYRNGTDDKPYLYSLQKQENNPETGYFWFTYEQTKWPKESFTLLTQSHDDIQLKQSSMYVLWYRKQPEEETQIDQNGIEDGS